MNCEHSRRFLHDHICSFVNGWRVKVNTAVSYLLLLFFGLPLGPPLYLTRVIIGGIMFPLTFFNASEFPCPFCPVLLMRADTNICSRIAFVATRIGAVKHDVHVRRWLRRVQLRAVAFTLKHIVILLYIVCSCTAPY